MTDLSRPRVGHVDRWVRVAVIAAIAATLAIVFVGPRVAWQRDADTIGTARFWFHNVLAIGFVVSLLIACIPATASSRYVRLAVLLPILQIVVLLAAWIAWQLLRAKMPSAVEATPLFEKLPIHFVLPWLAVSTLGGAWLVSRRGKREVLHAALMLALVNLLLLGLWLPLAAAQWNGEDLDAWIAFEHGIAEPEQMIAFVVVPPFLAALAFVATALRNPQVWRRNAGVVGALVLLALVLAVGARSEVSQLGAYVYINFMHVLASAAILAVGMLVALGIATWLAHARHRRDLDRETTLVGTITSAPNTVVAFLEQTSWLRGTRPACSEFVVTTTRGDVPIPAGTQVAAATPLATTLLRNGEGVPTLKVGDRVAIAGLVKHADGGPFRETSAPIPGSDGLVVGRIADERYGAGHVGLDLWRPSIAYLVICVAVALPGLAALLSSRF